MYRANHWSYFISFWGIVWQWACCLLLFVGHSRHCFRLLSRLSFAVVAGSGPFALYSLHNFHGCLVTFEDSLIILAILFILIPVFVRLFLVPELEKLAQKRERLRIERASQLRLTMPKQFRRKIFKEWMRGGTREPTVILWSGLGPEALLTRDGRILVNPDGWETDPAIRPASEDEFHMYTRARAGHRNPELYSMLPQNPENSSVCSRCGGSGWHSAPITDSKKIFCRACDVRGYTRL